MSRLTAVDLYISEATDDQQGVLQELRDLIFEAVPDVKEQFKWSQPVYGTTKDFVYLKHTKKHLNLGFFNLILMVYWRGPVSGCGILKSFLIMCRIERF